MQLEYCKGLAAGAADPGNRDSHRQTTRETPRQTDVQSCPSRVSRLSSAQDAPDTNRDPHTNARSHIHSSKRNWCQSRPKSLPKWSQIDTRRFQGAQEGLRSAHGGSVCEALRPLGSQNGQLGSILEAQEAPKSTPKREKIDDENACVFEVDFLVVHPSFWDDFW